MNGLEMHLMFCYNSIFDLSSYMFILLYRVNKIMFTAFQSPKGGRLIEVGLYIFCSLVIYHDG